MKKKIVSTMLCATMIATMLAGCGGSDNGGSAATDNGGSAATDNGGSTEEAAPAGDSADTVRQQLLRQAAVLFTGSTSSPSLTRCYRRLRRTTRQRPV